MCGDKMIYLDYSATTPVNKEVLETYNKVITDFIGNPNSSHRLGVEANELINKATNQIASILGINSNEIIYTSGATEANNTAIKGIALKYQNRGNHIITSPLEHSSVYGPLNYLQKNGFEVDFVNLKEDGTVDLEHLKELLKDTTILVSIGSVNSETGIVQPIQEISNILKNYKKCFFHVDATQSLGKHQINFDGIDLASFSAQKFYGMKGIGFLYCRTGVSIEPLIHGGRSTTSFRSGTPATALIVSMSKALRLSLDSIDNKHNYVKGLNNYLKENLNKYSDVCINSTDKSLPHILNISVMGIKPDTFMNALEQFNIYISSQSACSGSDKLSQAVYAITKDEKRATSSLRISLSHLTTMEELDTFLKIFDDILSQLKMK